MPSSRDDDIADLWYRGRNTAQIARALHIPEEEVYNALPRIRVEPDYQHLRKTFKKGSSRLWR